MTLNEQEKLRLLQTLQEDPAFLAQVRSLILPAELVQLPERFAQFASHVMAFIERQGEFNAEFRDFITRQDEFNARQEEFNAGVTNRLHRITDDLGDLKGHVAGRIAREMADDIGERLGFEIIQQLSGNDLRRMLRQHKPADISPGVRRSFYLADLVAKVEDEDGNQLFIAAEASYTADERDTQRAIRNAEFLTRFTGINAIAVIASRDNDHAVQQLVDRGAVRWFRFEPRDLQPQ